MLTSTSPVRHLGLLAAVALLVTACGGQAAIATPIPTPTPSPTPLDVGSIVLKAIHASDYSAEYTLKGSGALGDQSFTTTGTWDSAGRDSHNATHISMGTDSWTTDSIDVGGKTWNSSAGGPYIPSANTSCNTVNDSLHLATALTDEGIVTRDGQKVHRLTIAGGVDAECTASTSTSVTGLKVVIDLYATDAGKLVAISDTETWTQLSGGSPLSATATIEATPTGKPGGTIASPSAPWSLYENTEAHFRVAYPADWSEQLIQDRPSLQDADHKYLIAFIVSKVPAGYALSDYSTADRNSLNSLTSLTMNATQAAGLGGEAGGLFEFHYTSGSTPLHALDVYTVHAGSSFDVFWSSAPGTEKADYQLYSNIVNSFVFTQ